MAFPHENWRDFLVDLEEHGELHRINKEVDWNLEAGAITRRAMEISQGRNTNKGGQPVLLFENIKGYPKGYRMLGNIVTNPKQCALMLGHPDPDNANLRDLQDLFLEGYEHPIKPEIVETGACKENKVFDDDCDLYRFPAPMIHEGDGGRYICSYHTFNTKDRNTGWVNWGTYRLMIHDRRSLGILLVHGQHGADMYFNQYEANDEPMPFAISITPDPLTAFSGFCPFPTGVEEVDVVGGWRKKPVKLVKCETNDLYVPADSEIVIEGIIPPRLRAYEGPFGEYTGFRASPRDLRPIGVVKCITWRNDPIMGMTNMGMPVAEHALPHTIGNAALFRRGLQDMGWPVVDVNLPLEVCDLTVVTVKKGRPRVAQGVMGGLLAIQAGVYVNKVLVCDEDVDIFNLGEILISMVDKVHPENGLYVYHHQGNPLFPFADLNERLTMTGPQLLMDATWPLDWPPEIAVPPMVKFKYIYPESVQKKVLSDWDAYGLKE